MSGKEHELSLSLKAENVGGTTVLRCKGRIVFRDEVTVLSQRAGELIERGRQLILDFAGVTAIDSAGLGELVALHMWAQASGCRLKIIRPSGRVRYILELTNLSSILTILSSEEEALTEPEAEVA
jgi:anti-anti-sigma factor